MPRRTRMWNSRDTPRAFAYPERTHGFESYVDNSDEAKEAFEALLAEVPGLSQHTREAMADLNGDILDLPADIQARLAATA